MYIRTLIESSEKRYLRKHWELIQNGHQKSDFKIKNIEFYIKNAIIECSLSPNSFSNNLNFLLFNIRSMVNLEKRKKLANFVNTFGFDFFFIVETLLTDSFEDEELFLAHFRFFCLTRPTRDFSLSRIVLIGVKSTFLTAKLSIVRIPGIIEGYLFLISGKRYY